MEVFNQQVTQIFKNPVVLAVFVIWSVFWKGLALWRSAGKRQLIWFIIILLVNTMGILEIAYVFYLNKYDLDKGKLLVFLEKEFKKIKKS